VRTLSETAEILSGVVRQTEVNQLRRVVGTPRVGDVISEITRRHSLRNSLQVSSALVELAVKKGR